MWGSGPRVSADRGSTAAGRDVNIFFHGILPKEWPALLKAAVEPVVKAATDPLERLNAEQRSAIAELERQLASTQEQVLGFLRIVGEAGIAVDAIPGKLVEIAERYQTLVAQAGAAPGDDPETARLKAELQAALERVDLDRADALLAEILDAQDRDLERRALEATATCAQRGEVAMTRLCYSDAAEHFAIATNRARLLGKISHLIAHRYEARQADALYHYGAEIHNIDVLRKAERLCFTLSGAVSEVEDPVLLVSIYYTLGMVQWALSKADRYSMEFYTECAVENFSRALHIQIPDEMMAKNDIKYMHDYIEEMRSISDYAKRKQQLTTHKYSGFFDI
jgi:hypothetical protein